MHMKQLLFKNSLIKSACLKICYLFVITIPEIELNCKTGLEDQI